MFVECFLLVQVLRYNCKNDEHIPHELNELKQTRKWSNKMQNISGSIYKCEKMGIFFTLNGQFASSNPLNEDTLCYGIQPSPGNLHRYGT